MISLGPNDNGKTALSGLLLYALGQSDRDAAHYGKKLIIL